MATKAPLPTTPVHEVTGPEILYFGDVEKAKLVQFVVNPKAKSYTVHDSGMVVETL